MLFDKLKATSLMRVSGKTPTQIVMGVVTTCGIYLAVWCDLDVDILVVLLVAGATALGVGRSSH
jgi:hypothetical protein